MSDKYLAVIVTAFLPGLAMAQVPQNHQCSLGDLKRRVEILYETGVTVPCEVHYYKDTEAPGERQVLWRALNESGYCERKTGEFIAKLTEMGWDCGQVSAPTTSADPGSEDEAEPADEPAEPDDTGALTPADNSEESEGGP